MKRYKKQLLILAILMLMSSFIEFVIAEYPSVVGVCENMYKNCFFRPDVPAEMFFFLTVSIFIFTVLLFFLKEPIYKSWRKFAIMFLPIAVILIMITPEHSSSFLGGLSFGYEREGVSILLSALFSISSLVLIIWKSVKLLKK